MFFSSKESHVERLKKELSEAKQSAVHFYNMKDTSEQNASLELEKLALEMGVNASSAAKTKRGVRILSEVVLNRQWAFYWNEKAIQLQAEINKISPTPLDTHDDYWFDCVVTPAGIDIVKDQIDVICSKLILETDERIGAPSLGEHQYSS